ncbi:DUF4214 domain-containing protein [Pseudomonas sp. Pseusp122]|uniref:DUF4214 domain-containing protein n=1 Tax=unclassified Pseudomonas TaxID=196821 RepID=UPI0039A43397
MAASTYLAQVQQLYIAYFGRPADPIGQAYWAGIIDAAGGNIAAVQAGFSASAESQALYGNKSTIDKVTAIYQNVFNRSPDAAGLAFWVAQIDSGKVTQAQASWTIQQNAGAGDAATVQNKLTAAQAFTAQIDTAAEISGYQGSAAAASGRTFLNTVTSDNATATAAVAGAQTAVTAATAVGSVGTTFVLTTTVDNLLGDGGNNTFIGDNSGATASNTVSAADQINGGAGTDTFKYFVGTANLDTALVLPQLTSVENVYIKGGTLVSAATGTNFAALTGVTGIEIDTPAVLTGNVGINTSAAQTVRLDGVNASAASVVALNNATNVTLNGVGTDATNTSAITVDLVNSTATTATINALTAASKVTLANTGAKVATLNITGDQNLTLTESLATLKTINASTATGKVSVNASGTTVDAAFAFTGGTGADTLTLSQASLAALTSGAQLAGGAGIDTLGVTAATANLALVAADYKAINASTGFEVLALGGTATSAADASSLTSIKEFAVSAGVNTISKVATGSILDIVGNTTGNVVTGAVGVTDLTINTGSTTATAGTTAGTLNVTGLTNITINSNIKAGTVGATNSFGALTQSDNSTFTIKGNGDTTLSLGAATATGSKIDGSAATGILKLTGNTATLDTTKASIGDVLIGGSGNDVLTTGANSSTLTGGAGKDSFVIKAVVGAGGTPVTTITDFAKGDSLTLDATFTATSLVTKVDLSSVAAGKTDVEIATLLIANTATAGNVAWGTYNGNTYVVEDNGTIKSLDATDTVVKLTGTQDLSTSTHAAAGVLVYA